ncbi:MAG TPA: beta-galactosidase trimerization domain-containing protein, partial [Lentzea sp.]
NVPVTTNMMLPGYQNVDLWALGREVDVVAIDHYPDAPGLDAAADAAFAADRARSFAGGTPWLLMEQGTSTVYQGDRVLAKQPGEVLRHSLAHIARGSEGALFFQWRQSKAGAEQWHSAMVPHAGPDSRVFREVKETGAAVARLAELAGSTVTAHVAVLHDSDAWWALNSDGLPSSELDYHPALRRAHRAFWDAGVVVDFAHPEADLDRYRLVVAPALYLLSDAGAENLRRYVVNGGTLLVQHFSGVVDDRLHARRGGFPAAPLREALGIRVEEHRPLARGERVALSDGSHGTAWSESLRVEGAEVIAAYASGSPALTRNRCGAGTAWYLSTRLDDVDHAALVGELLDSVGVGPVLAGLPPGVDAVMRDGEDCRWHFVLNHRSESVALPGTAHDLLTGGPVGEVPAGGCVVLREGRPR